MKGASIAHTYTAYCICFLLFSDELPQGKAALRDGPAGYWGHPVGQLISRL